MPPSRIYGRLNHFLSLNRNYRYLLLTSRDYLETLVSKDRNLGAAIDIRHGQLFDFGCRGFTSRCDLNKSTLHNCKGLPLLRGKNTARSWQILNLHHHFASQATATEKKSKKMLYYLTGLVFAMVGYSYAAVPLYRRFCQATGYGDTVQRRESVEEKIARHAKDGRVASREMLM